MRHRKLNRILERLHANETHPDTRHREVLEEELLAAYRRTHRSWRWTMLVNPQRPWARWAIGTLLLALLGMGACEVPTSYQVEMGKQLQIQLQAASVPFEPGEMARFLQGLPGVDDASVSVGEAEGQPASLWIQVWGFDLDSRALVSTLEKEYPAMDGAHIEVQPLQGTVHGTLKDRLGESLFDIHVTGDTADEIRAEILAQLAAQGFDGDAVVDVQTDGDTKTITIETTTEN